MRSEIILRTVESFEKMILELKANLVRDKTFRIQLSISIHSVTMVSSYKTCKRIDE